MASRPGFNINCNHDTCLDYQSLRNRHAPKKGDLPLDKIDMDHIHQDHLRIWGEFGWECREKEVVKNLKATTKIAQLEAELSKLKLHLAAKKVSPTPAQAAAMLQSSPKMATAQPHSQVQVQVQTNNQIDADPSLHQENICDALFASGNAILKCTDPVRRGRRVCALHLTHTDLVKETSAK
jgi:hypothetical protein